MLREMAELGMKMAPDGQVPLGNVFGAICNNLGFEPDLSKLARLKPGQRPSSNSVPVLTLVTKARMNRCTSPSRSHKTRSTRRNPLDRRHDDAATDRGHRQCRPPTPR